MPLVKIDMIKGVRSPEEIKKLADVVQEIMLAKFNAPPRDRCASFPFAPPSLADTLSYQIITQHEPYELICEDTNLGFTRTDKLVFIQIFQQGRNAELKQAIYAALKERLEQECGVPGTDLIVSCSANTKEDWSFGMGRAQFLTGEL
jgi:phenylpyruvate tautomerase PptA (4-oxalocrotonate tautomerase family)